MNWLEREVPSLELCKKLKEVGYPQAGGGFYWWKWGTEKRYRLALFQNTPFDVQFIKAPTVRELFVMLPDFIEIEEFVAYFNNTYIESPHFDGNLPDRLAKMVIWLKQHGYIDFKKEA